MKIRPVILFSFCFIVIAPFVFFCTFYLLSLLEIPVYSSRVEVDVKSGRQRVVVTALGLKVMRPRNNIFSQYYKKNSQFQEEWLVVAARENYLSYFISPQCRDAYLAHQSRRIEIIFYSGKFSPDSKILACNKLIELWNLQSTEAPGDLFLRLLEEEVENCDQRNEEITSEHVNRCFFRAKGRYSV